MLLEGIRPSSQTVLCSDIYVLPIENERGEMMKKPSLILVAILLSIGSTIGSAKGQSRDIDVAAERISGDKVRGPATLRLRNLNVLRYDIQIGSTVTFTKGPDLTLPFIPPIPSKPAQAQAGAGQAALAGDPIGAAFALILLDIDEVDDNREHRIELPIAEAIAASNSAKGDLEALVLASDSLLRGPGGPQAVINGIGPVLDRVNVALSRGWPELSVRELLGKLDRLKLRLLTLPATPVQPGDVTWAMWINVPGNKLSYDAALARIDELKTRLTNVDFDSEPATKFRDARNKLSRWRPILTAVRDGGVAAFSRTVTIGCGFGFDQTKSTRLR
jgi:hypothetical protein